MRLSGCAFRHLKNCVAADTCNSVPVITLRDVLEIALRNVCYYLESYVGNNNNHL